jgi:RNA polymerase sigma factor FliA
LTVVDAKTGDLWAAYKRDGQHAARDELILRYAPLVQYVAGRMGAGLPSHVDRADLVS